MGQDVSYQQTIRLAIFATIHPKKHKTKRKEGHLRRRLVFCYRGSRPRYRKRPKIDEVLVAIDQLNL